MFNCYKPQISLTKNAKYFISDYRKYHAAFTINREHLKIEQTGKPAYPTGKKEYRLDEQIREVIVFQPKWEKEQLELDIELAAVNYTGNEEFCTKCG